jgi:hypothetical protein
MAVLKISPVKKIDLFLNLKQVKRMTEWEDIKVGEIYHIPPLVYNDRISFKVIEKKENSLRLVKLGESYSQTIFKTDITSNFIVKKWCCNEG